MLTHPAWIGLDARADHLPRRLPWGSSGLTSAMRA